MAGYSGTPLAGKLGIKPGSRLCACNAPANYDELLAPLPEGVARATKVDAATQMLHCSSPGAPICAPPCPTPTAARRRRRIWISWPKKASKVPTDITEDTIRSEALPLG